MANVTKTHELKMDADVFGAAWGGLRPFSVRKEDGEGDDRREFHVGDILIERETVLTGEEIAAQRAEHGEDYEVEYTGREIHSHVKYIERGPKFGLADGWVIMTVKPYRKVPE